MTNKSVTAIAAILAVGACLTSKSASAQLTGSVTLTASKAHNCYITVTPVDNTNLPFADGTHTAVHVADVVQHCNKKAGYTLWISSANCSSGARLLGTGLTPESVHYKVSFNNPNTAGAEDVDTSNLLDTVCDETPPGVQTTARLVDDFKVGLETSNVYIDYEILPALEVDNYSDTLTFNMTVD